jgi:hypothetical protein
MEGNRISLLLVGACLLLCLLVCACLISNFLNLVQVCDIVSSDPSAKVTCCPGISTYSIRLCVAFHY